MQGCLRFLRNVKIQHYSEDMAIWIFGPPYFPIVNVGQIKKIIKSKFCYFWFLKKNQNLQKSLLESVLNHPNTIWSKFQAICAKTVTQFNFGNFLSVIRKIIFGVIGRQHNGSLHYGKSLQEDKCIDKLLVYLPYQTFLCNTILLRKKKRTLFWLNCLLEKYIIFNSFLMEEQGSLPCCTFKSV